MMTFTARFFVRARVMLNGFIIFFGGGLGSLARWWASSLVAERLGQALPWGQTFPWGTLLVNVSGSFAIGLFATLTGPDGRFFASAPSRTFFMIGFCGGYTTFSSFSLQTLNLAEDGQWFRAGANAVLSLALCLIAVWLGHSLALALNSAKGR
jgi:CrcB protein